MKTQAGHNWTRGLKLLQVLQQMAAQKTNATLLLLQAEAAAPEAGGHETGGPEATPIETCCRYPDAGLLFANNGWRVFYHCHESDRIHPDEHGHFHCFTLVEDDAWAHVAGLSIDRHGQPLQWFAVNRWVTDGPWLPADRLDLQMQSLDEDESNLVASWLSAMLRFYQPSLQSLLQRRDRQLDSLRREQPVEKPDDDSILEERSIYTLATETIRLSADLQRALANDAGGRSAGSTEREQQAAEPGI